MNLLAMKKRQSLIFKNLGFAFYPQNNFIVFGLPNFIFIYAFINKFLQSYINSQLTQISMNRLSKFLHFSISKQRQKLYLLSHRVSDVLKIRDIQNDPYVIIDGNKVQFPMHTYIGNVKVPNVNTFLKFYDMRFNYYYNSTSVSRILNQSFFLQIEQQLYFVVNHDPLVKLAESPIFQSTEANAVLEPIVCQTLKELQTIDTIQRVSLINMLMKNVMDRSFELKQEQLMFREFLKIVQKKIADIEADIRLVEFKLGQKAKKRVRWFTNFIIAEVALLHYFIYFNLSWDVMEPITVIIANIDLMAAYWFFIIRGSSFSPKNWENLFLRKKKNKYLSKHGIDVRKYEQYLQIREHMRLRLNLFSCNPQEVLQTLQKPIKLMSQK